LGALVRVGVGLALVRVGVGCELDAPALGRGARVVLAEGARVALVDTPSRAADADAELLASAGVAGAAAVVGAAVAEVAAGVAGSVLGAEPVALVVPHAASSSGTAAAAAVASTGVRLVMAWCPKVRLT
jgi:hypothetical protein